MNSHVAGIDIGGTKTAAALVSIDGEIVKRVETPTPAAQGSASVLRTAADLVADLGPFGAVGVGSAGVVDHATGTVRSATDALPGWTGTDIRGELRRLLRVPVTADNDVHAHALGEHWQGAARGFDTVLAVTVGTGVGGSLIVGGGAHHGAHSAAGHLGHLPTPAAAGRRCPCGAGGHLEAVASGPALLSEYVARTGTSVSELAEVAARARAGDPIATEVLAGGAAAVGAVIGGVVNLLDPDVVVVGGGVAGSGAVWWSRLRPAVEAELLPALSGVSVVPAELGADSALVGAARLAWEQLR
ncbi:ROK family protein [Haloactinomyces albus]|uniref:Glucokinase n=1 Tax=Haloactinomyces albus TaxID=1352928 RepID=A0AAE4CMM3_9ACTN|nr:ROK family protein [Haloactinomyces albus]MDR7303550.1 glucokinase [Haloactinomyces albus]